MIEDALTVDGGEQKKYSKGLGLKLSNLQVG